jgi:hypothetical protein
MMISNGRCNTNARSGSLNLIYKSEVCHVLKTWHTFFEFGYRNDLKAARSSSEKSLVTQPVFEGVFPKSKHNQPVYRKVQAFHAPLFLLLKDQGVPGCLPDCCFF